MAHTAMTHPDHRHHSGISGTNGEKRRSKLGYHRTSVACGHCRRRKIRCIPSPNDPRGRCINCIRLKKDCSFYPVDQMAVPETRKTQRSSVGQPTRARALPRPTVQDMRRNELLTMPSTQTHASQIKTEAYSPEPLPARDTFEYGSNIVSWVSGASPGASKAGDMATFRYESAATHNTHTPDSWTLQHPDATGGSRTGDDLWPYQPRSVSFSSDTMSSSGHHASHPPQPYPSIAQMTRGAHHGGSSIPGVDSSGAPLDHHVPLSGPAYPGWSSGAYPSEPYCAWDPGASSDGHTAPSMYYTR